LSPATAIVTAVSDAPAISASRKKRPIGLPVVPAAGFPGLKAAPFVNSICG